MEIDLEVCWRLRSDGEVVAIDKRLFALLRGIKAGGNLKFAAKAEGVSYRHAWGLLRGWEQRLGAPLLISRQGRGATLTELGAELLRAVKESDQALHEALVKSALRASATIDAAIEKDRRRVRIASSHDEKILQLRDGLEAARHNIALEILGSEGALRNYRRGDADLAGFHLPMGELGRTVAAKLIGFLDDKQDEIFLVEKRVLGLMSRDDMVCRTLDELIAHERRFVNRQVGSATRLTFDGLLGARGLAPGDIIGYPNEEYTHTAVAALVASRGADAAFGSQHAATQFDLVFAPMVEERFYLVINREFDSTVRQHLTDFCAQLNFDDAPRMKADEFVPSVAVVKRVHNAGFWKKV
ncbi:MAG: LysR family transcriptional regulator [Proteobacteria bacterium]|nr:MAG: LysR family transcriptional regulator [Pseudomonadota bacterium]